MKDVFVTYAWEEDPEHQKLVFNFTNFLRSNGFDAEMDLKVTQGSTSTDFMQMMHRAMTDYRKVIIVLSTNYKKKAEKFTGGVGVEYGYIIKLISDEPKKFILATPYGRESKYVPLAFKNVDTIDISLPLKILEKDRLFAKLLDQNLFEFAEVASTKPVLTPVFSTPFEVDIKNAIIDIAEIASLNAKQSGGLSQASLYNYIDYTLNVSVQNNSTHLLKELNVEISIPSSMFLHLDYESYEYQFVGNRVIITRAIQNLFPKQVKNTELFSVRINYTSIDTLLQEFINTKLFTEHGIKERMFSISENFYIHGDYEVKPITKDVFLPKNGFLY